MLNLQQPNWQAFPQSLKKRSILNTDLLNSCCTGRADGARVVFRTKIAIVSQITGASKQAYLHFVTSRRSSHLRVQDEPETELHELSARSWRLCQLSSTPPRSIVAHNNHLPCNSLKGQLSLPEVRLKGVSLRRDSDEGTAVVGNIRDALSSGLSEVGAHSRPDPTHSSFLYCHRLRIAFTFLNGWKTKRKIIS